MLTAKVQKVMRMRTLDPSLRPRAFCLWIELELQDA